MSFLQGCASCFTGKRFTEKALNEKIANGMRVLKKKLTDSSPLSEDDAEIIKGWSDDRIDKVERGDCIPPGSFWTPGILEFYISLVTPAVRLMYFKQHG